MNDKNSRGLEGVRIIDMSAVQSGPFATHFLADLGADVIKVEPPEGDISRHAGASLVPGMSSLFQHLNRGKRSIVLDLKIREDLLCLHDLIRSADALVFNSRPQSMKRLGLAYGEVREIKPSIVYCGITGYGERGRYGGKAAYDDLIQGATGVADLMAKASGGSPAYVPLAMADRIVGLYAAIALMAALLERQRTGSGACIELPMFETMCHFVLIEHMYEKSFDPVAGSSCNPRSVDRNRRPYPTRDGFVCVLPYTDRHWHELFGLIGKPECRNDPHYANVAGRSAHISKLHAMLSDAFVDRTTAEWLELFDGADIPAARLNKLDDIVRDPHLDDVGFFRNVQDEAGRSFLQMASPLSIGPDSTRRSARVPGLGEHTDEIKRELAK